MPKDLIQRLDWSLIYPPFMERCFELAARCRARGVDYFATSGFRSPEEQLKLWQQGRNEKGAVVNPKLVVTNLQFGLHNAGVAVDWTRDVDTTKKGLQPRWKKSDYTVLAEEATALGLEAGYYWKHFNNGNGDAPHVQLPISKKKITVLMLRGLVQKGGVKAAWGLLDRNGPWT